MKRETESNPQPVLAEIDIIHNMNEFNYSEGVQPENDLPEDAPIEHRSLRFKALLLLLVLFIPTILFILEITTGRISLFWQDSIQPILPQLYNIVNF